MSPRLFLWLLLPVLLILHQDYWQWDDASLWFGFLPQGLFYHLVLSLVAAAYWWVMVIFAWPTGVDDVTDETGDEPSQPVKESGW